MDDFSQMILNYAFFHICFIANYFVYVKKKNLPRWREVAYLIVWFIGVIGTAWHIISRLR